MTLHAGECVGCGDPRAHVAGFSVRFREVVRFGDTLALRRLGATPEASVDDGERRRSRFELLNQDGRVATSGSVEVRALDPAGPRAFPAADDAGTLLWPGGPWQRPSGPGTWYAEDVLEHGPRGASPVRTVTEADVVSYANFSGELNPLYVNARFAERSIFGGRIAPPMLCFCLGFSVWLRELMKLPLAGGEDSAGIVGKIKRQQIRKFRM